MTVDTWNFSRSGMCSALVLSLLVVAAGCEQRIEVQETAPAPEQPAPEPTAAPAADAEDPDPAFTGAQDPVERERETESIVVLDEVRSAARNGYDRVVFELRGNERPGYHVRYGEPPFTHCASGEEIPVDGNAFLEISLSPAAGYVDRDGERQQTVADRDRRPGLAQVVHLRETCDHHGGVGWVIGLNDRTAFRVLDLDGPQRLVIDIRHP
jgi:hypothetical protein